MSIQPNGKCHSCGRELTRMYALFCSYKCSKDDECRYVGESIEKAIERRLRKTKGKLIIN